MSLLTSDSPYASSSYYPTDLPSSSDSSSDSLFTDRSTWNIFWSCAATIFACIWISVHQNVPAPNDSTLRVLGRRLAIMFYMLIAPELVIAWTRRQYVAASAIVERHKSKGWTKTHAFFVVMGGFSLYKDGVLVCTLEIGELEKLYKEGKVEWPTVTEAEIKDKSKGDFFSKGVVVLQTTWFIVQCIVRAAKKMVLTELEIETLAYSTLTIIIYALWWNKPLDVRISVPVYLKEGCSHDPKPRISGKDKSKTRSTSMATGGDLQNAVRTLFEIIELPEMPLLSEDAQVENLPSPSLLTPNTPPVAENDADIEAQNVSERSKLNSLELVPDMRSFPRPYHDPSLSLWQKFCVYLKTKQIERGLIDSTIYIFMIRPIRIFFRPLVDMIACKTLKGRQYRVPTFYSPPIEDSDGRSLLLAFYVALVFGGIHCNAWSVEFPTAIEKWIWMISALLVSGVPTSMVFIGMLIPDKIGDQNSEDYAVSVKKFVRNVMGATFILLIPLYIAARGALLILPLIALRELPAGAYLDLNWTAYLPHF